MATSRSLASLSALALLLFSQHAWAGSEIPISTPSPASISPDGRQIVFSWRGEIWTAPSGGGLATRLTRTPEREVLPRFSLDGSHIYFCSKQSGARQIYSMPATGGKTTRLTRHSEGSLLEAVAPDGSFLVVRGPRDGPEPDADRLLAVPPDGSGAESMLFDTEGHSASVSPDGRRILFCRRGEQTSRKGYRGPRASQIWMFDRDEHTFTPVVCEDTEARWPMWLPDGKSFLYVSERDGTFNLWKGRIGSGKAEQLTRFRDDGVNRPSVSADGKTLIFRRGFDIYRFRPGSGKPPAPIRLATTEAPPDNRFEKRIVTGTVDADTAPGTRTTILAAAGDLWLLENENLVRLTETPEREKDIAFLPDGSGFWFLRDDGVAANYHLARRNDPALPWSPGNLATTPVTSGPAFKCRLKPSPDGTRIAWVQSNGDLHTANADGSNPALVFECWDPPTFDWSPDSRWLVLAAEDRNSNRDLYLVPADASSPATKITRNPGFDGTPRWSPDGRKIAYLSRRGPPGSERELFLVNLGPSAPGHLDPKSAASATPVRITTRGIEPCRLVWSPDSREILFQSTRSSNKALYAAEAKQNGKMRKLAAQRGLPGRFDADGTFHWIIDRTPATLRYTPPGKSNTPAKPGFQQIPRTRVVIDRRARNRLTFRMIWRTLGRRFYDPGLNGRDWPAMLAKYEPYAANAQDWRTYDRTVSMLMGELNASHLYFVAKQWPRQAKRKKPATVTRHLGLRVRPAPDGKALVVASVLPGSPASEIDPPIVPGTRVLAIDTHPVTAATPLLPLLEGKPGSTVRMVLRASGGKELSLPVKTITYPQARRLATKARLAKRRQTVANATNNRAAYLSLHRMNPADLAGIEEQIYHASESAEGLVLDLRDNEGGTTADRLLSIFCHPDHALTIPRGGPPGYPLDRIGHPVFSKPLVVLINQNTFSNAEILAHALKRQGRATLVGTRTSGGVISAAHDRIPGAGVLRIPVRGWFDPLTGADLEMNGARPDIPVDLSPADEESGADPQLAAAIRALVQSISSPPPSLTPHYRH